VQPEIRQWLVREMRLHLHPREVLRPAPQQRRPREEGEHAEVCRKV
jgi:hypothetical protein